MTQTAAAPQSLVAQTAQDLNISAGYLQLVKDVYAKNATDEELALFLRTAHRLGLDPTARQIYLVKRWDGGLKREVATPQTSIDGFRLIADRTDRYVPGRETTYEYDEQDKLKSATAYCKKQAGGEWHEISATAFYAEYVQKTKEGKPNSMWLKMPHLMLGKCAESLVLRKAFPAELSGIYTSEEMGSDHYDPPRPATKGELVAAATAPAQPEPEPEAIDAEAVPSREECVAEVQSLCKALNAAGDSITWKAATLKGYVNDLFNVEDGLDSLGFESFQTLIEDLQVRLADLENA